MGKQDYYIKLPESYIIDTENLSKVFDNTTMSYKFFWFKALLRSVKRKIYEPKVIDLLQDMVLLSYYMVNECNLCLGYKDGLYDINRIIKGKYNVSPKLSTEIVISDNIIQEKLKEAFILQGVFKDDEISGMIYKLRNDVATRFIKPFIANPLINKCVGGWSKDNIELINNYYFTSLNKVEKPLPYFFDNYKNPDTCTIININEYYVDYFTRNYDFLDSFCNYYLAEYLQKRNPTVPGIINKIMPEQRRDTLNLISSFYKEVIENSKIPILDIYTENDLRNIKDNFSIDHFIPWSYIANNEMWNLTPTDQITNSTKSNYLPSLDKYLNIFLNQKWLFWTTIRNNNTILCSFYNRISNNEAEGKTKKFIYTEEFIKLFLNDEIENESDFINFYRNNNIDEFAFKNTYEENIKKCYAGAKNCGFELWVQ